MIMQQILMMGRIRFGILNLTAVTTFLISPSLIEIYMFGGVSPLLQRVATAKRKKERELTEHKPLHKVVLN